MKQKENNGQKQTSLVENIIFNSANGFAQCGIEFDGNYKKGETCTYCKGLQVGGQWIGLDALSNVLEEAIRPTLIWLVEKEEPEDEEAKLYEFRLLGNTIQSCRFMFLMRGYSKDEAEHQTIELVQDLKLGFTKKEIKDFLSNPLFIV